MDPRLEALPGGDLVEIGIDDLARGVESIPALLVSIGAERLGRAGVAVPGPVLDSPERRLYDLLASEDPNGAHSRYNALIRRLVSCERALECGGRPVDRERVLRFLRQLGAEAEGETRLYFTGAGTAVLLGWRSSTIDLDIKLEPESDRLLRALPALKERLEMNVELAAPDDFIPELPGWRDRSAFAGREGKLSLYHYDLAAQALAKIERGHAQDVSDVREMLARGLVGREELRERFATIEPQLYRYPAIDPASFRLAVERATLAPQTDRRCAGPRGNIAGG